MRVKKDSTGTFEQSCHFNNVIKLFYTDKDWIIILHICYRILHESINRVLGVTKLVSLFTRSTPTVKPIKNTISGFVNMAPVRSLNGNLKLDTKTSKFYIIQMANLTWIPRHRKVWYSDVSRLWVSAFRYLDRWQVEASITLYVRLWLRNFLY